jgi:hypothetical protein
MSDPRCTPHTPSSQSEKDVPARWGRWQASQRAQHTPTPEAAARGYTALKVRPSLRPAFFALVELLSARGRCEDQLPHVLDAPEVVRTFADAQAAWIAWHTWTRRFAAYLDRLAAGREGTLPPVPDALTTLLAHTEEPDAG